jgi:membrane protease YdiL (CAAX protease family)
LLGIGKLLSLLPKTLPIKYLCEVILIVIPIALVFFFGFSKAFRKGNFFRGLFCCLPFIVLQLVLLAVFFSNNLGNPEVAWKPWYLILFGLFSVVGVGIREECIYRAIIQNIVAKKHANSVKGIWIAAIVGAVVFGLMHVSNIFFGMDLIAVLDQVVSATIVGLLFGAVYLRSGSLWALILVHTVTDITGLAKSTFLQNISDIENMNQMSFSWITILFWLFYIGLTVFLLRPSKCEQVYESFCFKDEEAEAAERT